MRDNASAANQGGQGNRKLLAFAVVLGLIGAGFVYIAANSGSSSSTTGPSFADAPVVVARVDIPARTRITPEMVDVRLVPAQERGLYAFTSPNQVVGEVTRFPMVAGDQVLSSKLVDLTGGVRSLSRSLSFVIPEGKRGFAISISEVANVGGLVLPGDYVDIIAIYDVEFEKRPGDIDSLEKRTAFFAQVLMQNVEVLAVSQSVFDVAPAPLSSDDAPPPLEGEHRVRNSEAGPNPGAGTITLLLTPEEAQRLYLAEAHARLRLMVRGFGDSEVYPIDYETELELLPPDLPNPFQVTR